MKSDRNERGVTLIELLVTFAVFSTVAAGFYSVMFSGITGSGTARSVNTISQEARLGINRMLRDTREARAVTAATTTSFTVEVDFDGSGQMPTPSSSPNGQGDYEVLTYSFDAAAKRILLNGEILIAGVEKASPDVFSYASNLLEHDLNGDGITTLAELETADQNGATLAPNKNLYISEIRFHFDVRDGDRVTQFNSEAQLRNRR